MSKHGYKLLLAMLRGLMYLKRGLVYLGAQCWRVVKTIDAWYRATIGFRIYKVIFLFQKAIGKTFSGTWGSAIIQFFGRRGTLQVVLLLVTVLMMIPQSRLYTKDINVIPGRQTLLYALVGPGDQDYSMDEIDATTSQIITPGMTWRQGAVTSEQGSINTAPVTTEPQDIAGISAGGGALQKPTILPGNTINTGTTMPGRTTIVYHTVEPGEVIGGIASEYGISIGTILTANKLTVRSYIRPGDKLKILPMNGVTHVVKRGDTIAKIARSYGADQKDIIAFNKLQTDGSDLVVGEEIMVPNGRTPNVVVPKTSSQRLVQSFSSISAPPPSIMSPADSGYLWPAGVHRISQYFGFQHTGIDIAGPIGTPIYASRDGIVVRSQCGWNGGYGCHIVIDHGGGYTTLYGHASQLLVSVGEQVTQGQTIALMGSTGHSTGPHCHFEVRLNGRRQNPLKYVR